MKLQLAPGLAVLALHAGCVSESSPDVQPLIVEGRALLEAHKPAEAQVLFERAAEADGDTFRTRMWVLRAWMDQGRSNDTLDALDALARAGRDGPEMDYLYGMAFVRRAEDHIEAGVTDSSIRMNFEEAVDRLENAVREDEELYRDALEPLAKAAWFAQELERARRAAEKAVARFPDDGRTWLTYGRVSMSLFRVEQDAEPWSPRAEKQWAAAEKGFARAVKAFGEPSDPAEEQLLSQAALEYGHTLMWKLRREQAVEAYATAMAWAPETIDFGQVRDVLAARDRDTGAPDEETGSGPDAKDLRHFNQSLEAGAVGFTEHHDADDPRGVALFWWLGWSRLELADYPGAEEAFLAALRCAPDAANSWFYVAMARYARDDRNGAIEALAKGWSIDPAAIVKEMRIDPDNHVARLEVLTGWAREQDRLADCALLSEICAETAEKDARHWHNMGIFLREQAAKIKADPGHDPAQLADLVARSFEAHQRAMQLTPDDPQLLDDTAVLLQYYLDRDLPLAMTMYERAIELAEKSLAAPDLQQAERRRIEAARDDAEQNASALRELLEQRSGAGDGE